MNDNIKILWNLIEEGFEKMCPLEAQAIENLITNYQEQEVFIGKLLKENKELSEENAILKRANNISEDVKIEDITKFINKSIEDFNKEYIPVAKIKEDIEDFKNKIVWGYNDWKYDEKVYHAELNIVEQIEKKLLEGK